MRKTNMLGQRFGRLIAIEERPPTPVGHSTWLCRCDCGKEVVRTSTSMKRSQFSSCGCWHREGVNNPLYRGVGEISGNWFWGVVHRAASGRKSRNAIKKKLEIDIEFIWSLFLKQDRKCALSGIVLTFPKTSKREDMKESTASLDRIDSLKGYTKDNVQWVHKDINRMKNVFSNGHFIKMCTLVSSNCAGGACEVS